MKRRACQEVYNERIVRAARANCTGPRQRRLARCATELWGVVLTHRKFKMPRSGPCAQNDNGVFGVTNLAR